MKTSRKGFLQGLAAMVGLGSFVAWKGCGKARKKSGNRFIKADEWNVFISGISAIKDPQRIMNLTVSLRLATGLSFRIKTER